MPTYEYVCDACGHALELFQSMTESPKRKCPACGKPKLRRLIGGGAGILFRGSGFYQTDYRSDSYKKAKDSDAGGGKAEPKPEGSKSDAKPAASEGAKSEAKPSAGTDKKGKPSAKP